MIDTLPPHALYLSHVWKVCWNPSFRLPDGDRAHYHAEGRLQVRSRGGREEGWLCPSDPRMSQGKIAPALTVAAHVRLNGDGGFATLRASAYGNGLLLACLFMG